MSSRRKRASLDLKDWTKQDCDKRGRWTKVVDKCYIFCTSNKDWCDEHKPTLTPKPALFTEFIPEIQPCPEIFTRDSQPRLFAKF